MEEGNSSHGLSEQTSLEGSIPVFPSRTAEAGLGSTGGAAVRFLNLPVGLSINQSVRPK